MLGVWRRRFVQVFGLYVLNYTLVLLSCWISFMPVTLQGFSLVCVLIHMFLYIVWWNSVRCLNEPVIWCDNAWQLICSPELLVQSWSQTFYYHHFLVQCVFLFSCTLKQYAFLLGVWRKYMDSQTVTSPTFSAVWSYLISRKLCRDWYMSNIKKLTPRDCWTFYLWLSQSWFKNLKMSCDLKEKITVQQDVMGSGLEERRVKSPLLFSEFGLVLPLGDEHGKVWAVPPPTTSV